MAKKQKYYAYFVPGGSGAHAAKHPRAHGVTDNWVECEKMVKGVQDARFKSFDRRADAEAWLDAGAQYELKAVARRTVLAKLEPGIYFDAGTGRGTGVEISVTDERGKNLLHKAIPKTQLNKFGKHLLRSRTATNNYGELFALRHALTIAKKEKIKKIFGDSRLVVDYWSKWHIKRNELPEETAALAGEVAKLREAFEKAGGTVQRISGDHNPADLGFHK